MFDQQAGQAATNHFIFSIRYECVTKFHEQCSGSKCHCLCHYRCNRAGNYVKITKAETKAAAEKAELEARDALFSVGGLLPGEAEMSDVPLTPEGRPKGFKCHTCLDYHEFDVYVLAHWHDRLVHECPGCGTKHAIRSGSATKVRGPRKGWVPF